MTFPAAHVQGSCRRLSAPLDDQRFSYSSPPYPLSMPVGSSLHEPTGFFVSPGNGEKGICRMKGSCTQKRPDGYPSGRFVFLRQFRREKREACRFARCPVLRLSRNRADSAPDRISPQPERALLQGAFPPESCLSCCRPYPRPRNASPASPHDRPREGSAPSGT